METESRALKYWNWTVQVCLPLFTLGSFVLVSLKQPQYSVIAGLISEVFWAYAAYRAWKEAGQWGIALTTVIATFIFAYGVLNYWFL